jgi:ABC-2 type transport system ATP-binding protein
MRLMDYIVVKDLVKKYKKYIAVNEISFSLDKGDVLGIIGENGAGKSTLMSMLVTLVRPKKGDIIYNEESIVASPYKIRGHIGYVPQDITLYEELTAMDNIKFFAKTYLNIYPS